jgi:hypothetical protein
MASAKSELLSDIELHGTFSIAASGANQTALAPEGQRNTAFTGMLLQLLQEGIDGGNEGISLKEIYNYIKNKCHNIPMMPEPQQSNIQDGADLVVARNIKFMAGIDTTKKISRKTKTTLKKTSIKKRRGFTSVLDMSPLADGNTFILRNGFSYDIGREGSGNTIEVPAGYLFDFRCLPKTIKIIFNPWGRFLNALVILDYLYWTQEYSRKESDKIFKEALHVLNCSQFNILMLYITVRLFSGAAWAADRILKEKGVQKVLPQ